jgi:hypothetical protein
MSNAAWQATESALQAALAILGHFSGGRHFELRALPPEVAHAC